MSLSAAEVVAASIALTWVPETATTEETDDYRLEPTETAFRIPSNAMEVAPS
jgi:hypothetical protein